MEAFAVISDSTAVGRQNVHLSSKVEHLIDMEELEGKYTNQKMTFATKGRHIC